MFAGKFAIAGMLSIVMTVTPAISAPLSTAGIAVKSLSDSNIVLVGQKKPKKSAYRRTANGRVGRLEGRAPSAGAQLGQALGAMALVAGAVAVGIATSRVGGGGGYGGGGYRDCRAPDYTTPNPRSGRCGF